MNPDIWSSVRQQQFINDPNMPFETFIDTKFTVSDFIILDKEVRVEGFFIKNFGRLRHQDGVSDSIVDQSLDPVINRSNVFKSGEASGASGSFFFFSNDRNFIVKTMTNKEMRFFCDRVANGYFNHLKENPESMLARIYGVYTVRSFGIQPVNIMLMAHTLKIKDPEMVQAVFDLKGSYVNRNVPVNKYTSKHRTLKDTNLLEMLATNKIKFSLSQCDLQLVVNKL